MDPLIGEVNPPAESGSFAEAIQVEAHRHCGPDPDHEASQHQMALLYATALGDTGASATEVVDAIVEIAGSPANGRWIQGVTVHPRPEVIRERLQSKVRGNGRSPKEKKRV